ncbi:hypothetical protein DXX93_13020 [Thalassotalea euphylliae]|uniref:J domain-containing protein n=1 Tax=Thalassotalea euphylliae TaxID=1655234 RepID=A0A3E0TSS8_9GAMM|nr:hypothetical protein [Thalassotalea euphylliae]REL27397.1 hypothetical protein DXX93_13020 [Thalassotalea euphylliae]
MNELVFTNQANKKSSKSENDTSYEYLNHLWQKIKKHEKRNQNLVNKQAKLYLEFVERIEPYEHAYCLAIANKAKRLISFMPRKSFSHAQQQALIEWIEEEISDIEYHPFIGNVDIGELRVLFQNGLSHSLKSIDVDEDTIAHMRTMFNDMFDGKINFSDEELTKIARQPELLKELAMQKFNELYSRQETEFQDENRKGEYTEQNRDQDDFDNDEDFESFFHNNHQQDMEEERQKELDQLFKSSQLNKMYKRLASVLHPDKAQDKAQKAARKELMQCLSDARQNKDAFTLLKLYQEYIPDAEFSFDDKTLAAIKDLLVDKAAILNGQYHDLKSNNTPQAIVWRKFSARSKKAIDLNFTEHLELLLNETAAAEAFLDKGKTVKIVGKMLSERLNQQQQWFFSKVDGDFESSTSDQYFDL